MTAPNLLARLRRLEGGEHSDGRANGVLVLPAGVPASSAEAGRLAAERRALTGWRGPLVLIPDNRRGDA